MRSRDFDYGTDSGPPCRSCGGTIYGYKTRDEYDTDSAGRPIDVEWYASAVCAACHAETDFPVGGQQPHDVRDVKACHCLAVGVR